MATEIDVVATLGFDDQKPIGWIKLNDTPNSILATCVLSPVVKILPSGKMKILSYGLIPMGTVPPTGVMKKRLRDGGADI